MTKQLYKGKNRAILLALILLLSSQSFLFAMGKESNNQDIIDIKKEVIFPSDSLPVVEASFSKDTILMGDQIDMVIRVYKDIAQNVGVPEITTQATDGVIEVIGKPTIDTLGTDGRKVAIEIRHKVTSFDAGGYKINPLGFIFEGKNKVDTLYSDSLMLMVGGYAIDTSTYVLHDIKPQKDAPISIDEVKYYIGKILSSPYTYLVLIFIGIIIALTWYLVRRKHLSAIPPKVEPAHIIAIRALEQLNHKHLWESGLHKEYYTSLSDILRVYLYGRFSINAMEMTSDEIFEALKTLHLKQNEKREIEDLLSLADFVKFAKYTPEAAQNSLMFQTLYNFVEQTKVVEDVKEGDITSPNEPLEIVVDNKLANETKEQNSNS